MKPRCGVTEMAAFRFMDFRGLVFNTKLSVGRASRKGWVILGRCPQAYAGAYVKAVGVAREIDSGAGWGYIAFATKAEAQAALDEYNTAPVEVLA